MFWRNPTAAFFNFLLPLLFLALFGAIFAGNEDRSRSIVPGIAGMSVMSTTFSALAMNVTYLREVGILKRIRGTPLPTSAYLAGIGGNAITNAALQVGIITAAGAVVFGLDWPRDWAALAVFVVARRVVLRDRSAWRSRTPSRTSTRRRRTSTPPSCR